MLLKAFLLLGCVVAALAQGIISDFLKINRVSKNDLI